MHPALIRIVRALVRYPASIAMAVFAVLAEASRSPFVVEPQLPSSPFNVLSVCFVIAAFAVAEHVVGTTRTLIVACVASVGAVLCSWAVVTLGTVLADGFSLWVEKDTVWAPSVSGVAVLLAASARLLPSPRRAVRWIVVGAATTFVLYDGHASDLARLIAACAGLGIGIVMTRAHGGAVWGSTRVAIFRRIVTAVLFVMGAGAVLTLLLPDAEGVLAPLGYLDGSVASLLIGCLLLLSSAFLLTGRRTGIILAVTAQLAVVMTLAVAYIIAPLTDGWNPWEGMAPEDVVLLAVCALPALLAVLLASAARRLTRRRPPMATAEDRARIGELARARASGSMSHMSTWAGNSYWFGPDGTTAIAYRVSKGIAFTVSDPIASSIDLETTARGFIAYCEWMGWVPVLYSVHDDVANLADQLGWAKTPVGVEAVLDLATFSLSGKRRQDLRTAANRARREGLTAVWTRFDDLAVAQREQVEALCARWAGHKKLPEMGFTLGRLAETDDEAVRLMLAVGRDGTLHGVTSWLPHYRDGELIGWTLDVMRRSPTAMPGTMEFLIADVALRAQDAGLESVSLSGTPLAPHQAAPATVLSRLTARLAHLLEPAYGFTSLHHFKRKFAPAETNLWMVYPGRVQLGRIGPALATTYVPELNTRHLARLLHPVPVRTLSSTHR